MADSGFDRSRLREGLDDPAERRAAGRMVGLLWLIGGVSGGLWYLVPGAETEHWQLGLVTATLSASIGIVCILAPWRRMSSAWIYAAACVSVLVIPVVMALNGGAESPTVLYLFMAAVLFGYYLPTGAAIAFLAVAALVPATPLLYDPAALEPTYLAKLVLTAPIYAGVGLAIVLAKRRLVGWRNEALSQALLDPLTELPNRRALTDALREAIETRRNRRPPGLLMMDLDDLKAINTTYGHVGGDTALRCVGEVLRRCTREDDLVARLGGDEFAVLVPAASEDGLARLAQRIVEGVRDVELKLTPRGHKLTASVGFTLLGAANATVDAFLAAADRELRAAKGRGKDQWGAILSVV